MLRFTFLLPILLALVVHLASAQTTLTDGYYQFESCGSDCTLSSNWFIESYGGINLLTTYTANETVSFYASGRYLLVYRQIYSGAPNMQVCLGASCTTTGSGAGGTIDSYPTVITLSGVGITDSVTIKNMASAPFRLDFFVIIGNPAAATWTPAPSVTPQPTWTPAPSVTPQPTWTAAPSITPAPTATPNAGAGGPDAASVYSTLTSGQPVRFDYVVSAGGIHIANVLTMIFVSGWSMFVVAVFVIWRRR